MESEASECVQLSSLVAQTSNNPQPLINYPISIRGTAFSGPGTQDGRNSFAGLALVIAATPVSPCRIKTPSRTLPAILSGGSLSLVRADAAHDLELPRQARSPDIMFVPDNLLAASVVRTVVDKHQGFVSTSYRNLFNTARMIADQIGSKPIGQDRLSKALVPGLIDAILRISEAEADDEPLQRKIYISPYKLRLIDRHIEERIGQRISAKDLARIANFSVFHLCRVMKLETGFSPHQYIMRHRIERAKSVLVTTDKPLVDVALDCGFANQSHFTTAFRKTAGCPPAQFRRANRS